MVHSPSPEPLGSIGHRSTSPPEVVCPAVGLKHQLPFFRDLEDEGSKDERTPKKAKFPKAPPPMVEQVSLPEPVAGIMSLVLLHKKGRPSVIVSERDKSPQPVVKQGSNCLAYLLQGLIYIDVSLSVPPLLQIILKGFQK